MNAIASALRRIGALTIDGVWRLGFATRFLLAVLLNSGQSLRRIHLTIRELYFSGVLSLLIIMVSGLFVGLVLGLQGYDILQRYGSADAVGVMVALSLLRELGPVIAALLFASRAGSAITAEIGLMKTTEQLKAMDMMAVNPIARVVAPRFWGGVLSMPLLAALFSAMGVFGGWLITVVVIGVDDGAPVGTRELLGWLEHGDALAVDQHVQMPDLGQRAAHQAAQAIVGGHVGRVTGDRPQAGEFDLRPGQLAGIATGDHHLCATAQIPGRDRLADAAGAADHQCGLAGEAEVGCCLHVGSFASVAKRRV